MMIRKNMANTCSFYKFALMVLLLCSLIRSTNSEAETFESQQQTGKTQEISVLANLPLSGASFTSGLACLAPINMALEDINARADVLPGYNLTWKYIDGQCHAGISVFETIQTLNRNKPFALLLGPACSTATEATNQLMPMWNRVQISLAAASPSLDDREKYPTLFRLAIPDMKYNKVRVDLLKQFNWKKVSVIYQAVTVFISSADELMQHFSKNNISIVAQELFIQDYDVYKQVEDLQKKDARIIYAFMYPERTRVMLCDAYKLGFYGPKIVWMFIGGFASHFWLYGLENLDCTAEQMAEVVEKSFLTNVIFRNPIEERGVANITVSEFEERFYSHPLYKPEYKPIERLAARCYDVMWLSAMALNCTSNKLRETGHPKTLGEFDYTDADINQMVFDCMEATSYIGPSGHISFDKNGSPNSIIGVRQIQDGVETVVAYYRLDQDPPYFTWFREVKWTNNQVPRDSTYVEYVEYGVPVVLYVVMCTVGVLGIALAGFFLRFNLVNRNNRIVKMSSPNINNILLLGCVLSYTTIMVTPTDATTSIPCKARLFSFALGFNIAFGALLTKTWRVYRIFINKQMERRNIKDSQLLVIIGVYLGVVMTILIVWEIVSPNLNVVQFLEDEVYTIGNDVEIRPYMRVCQSEHSGYFRWIMTVLQGALLVFGVFLAVETRHVKIEALNDSYEIGLCVYCVLVLSAMGLFLSLLLSDVVTLYGITSGCLALGTTLTQFLVFIPKVRAVYNSSDATRISIHPPGETGARDVISKPGGTSTTKPTTSSNSTTA